MKTFNLTLFIYLCIGFMFFTVIGTLSHEFGHYLVAKSFGYPAKINYRSTYNSEGKLRILYDTIIKNYKKEYEADLAYPGKENFDFEVAKYKTNHIFIILGGPIQTLLTSIIALIFVLINLDSFSNKNKLSFGKWIIVFLALFSLRQPANFFTIILGYLNHGRLSNSDDEAKIDFHFGLPLLTTSIITSILGVSVLAFIYFKIIPKQSRTAFMVAGLCGGVIGFSLWFYGLGKIVLP
ncbi:MAG: hypothetical protein ACOYMA_12505 [Bacteroidia bacterium]